MPKLLNTLEQQLFSAAAGCLALLRVKTKALVYSQQGKLVIPLILLSQKKKFSPCPSLISTSHAGWLNTCGLHTETDPNNDAVRSSPTG